MHGIFAFWEERMVTDKNMRSCFSSNNIFSPYPSFTFQKKVGGEETGTVLHLLTHFMNHI